MRKDIKPDLQKSVRVVKSDAEWRKTLTPEEFASRASTAPNGRSVTRIIKRNARECITASVAVPRCSAQKRSMIQGPAGRAFTPQ